MIVVIVVIVPGGKQRPILLRRLRSITWEHFLKLVVHEQTDTTIYTAAIAAKNSIKPMMGKIGSPTKNQVPS